MRDAKRQMRFRSDKMADNNSEPEAFDHEVSADLAKYIPTDVMADKKKLKKWVDEALEFGLKAKLQASVGIDTAIVGKEFDAWKDAVSNKLIGPKSDFEEGLKDWFDDSDGSFQKAFDLDDPKSPLSKFMKKQKDDRKTHADAMKALVEEIKAAVIKSSAPQQPLTMGNTFEEDIEEWLNNSTAKVMDDDIAVVGAAAIKGSAGAKTGDVLIKVDSPAAKKLRITIEAKSGLSPGAYTVKGLWEQISENMTLRNAQAGIGVVDINNPNKKHEPWQTKGRHRIIVAVDRDRDDFTLLKIAYHFLRKRIIEDELDKRKGKGAKAKKLDLAAFEDQLTKITDRLKSIGAMRGKLTRAKGILTESDKDLKKIKDGIEEDVEELLKLLRSAKS